MKVISYVIHEVVVPTHEGRVNSPRFGPPVWDRQPKFMIELSTDEGIIGLSETRRGTSLQSVTGKLRLLLGQDVTAMCLQSPLSGAPRAHDDVVPSQPHRAARTYERVVNDHQALYVQVAMLDLWGKKSGLPACQLLGGAFRTICAVDHWMGQMTPEDSVLNCRNALAAGYQGTKFKCTLEDDVAERAAAICDACGPQFKLVIDPNQRFWRLGDALDMLRALAAIGNLACIEDPFPFRDEQSYRRLVALGLCPVARHVAIESGQDVLHAIRQGLCDRMNLSLTPTDTRFCADICFAAGLPTWHGSGVELGVLEAAYLHVCAATQSMTLASDVFGRAIRQHNLITDPFQPINGFVRVPMSTGLGVTLDRDALDRYTVGRTTS